MLTREGHSEFGVQEKGEKDCPSGARPIHLQGDGEDILNVYGDMAEVTSTAIIVPTKDTPQ